MAKRRGPKKNKKPYNPCGKYITTKSDGTKVYCTRQSGHSMWGGHSPNRRN